MFEIMRTATAVAFFMVVALVWWGTNTGEVSLAEHARNVAGFMKKAWVSQ